jgi:hypothetical protein
MPGGDHERRGNNSQQEDPNEDTGFMSEDYDGGLLTNNLHWNSVFARVTQ